MSADDSIFENIFYPTNNEVIADLQSGADAGGEVGVGGEFVFVAEDGAG